MHGFSRRGPWGHHGPSERGMRGRGWGPDEEHGFGRGGGRRRRMFDGGELKLVLLKLIADEARHGYDLIRAIEEKTGGAYAPSPGVVYPTLTLLTEMGLVREVEAEGARKQFEITDEGRAHLAEHQKDAEMLIARLETVGAERERTDVAPVRRSMHNLKQVLHYRLAGGLSGDKLFEAVALIDEVAGKIERL